MYKYIAVVPDHVPNITLGNYVRKAFPLLSESAVRNAFARRDVKMDGVRCGREQRVIGGSEVAVFTTQKMRMPIVYEDERLLALDKPAGVSCDADAYGSMTVEGWAALYAQGQFVPQLCHRLDNQTSGLILLAKDEKTKEALQEMFAKHTGEKEYRCLVWGAPEPPKACKTAYLRKEAAYKCVKVSLQASEHSKQIITAYETLARGRASLLRVQLYTGRTHQIRAHMAYLGFPVVGDDLYGDRALNREYGMERLMLRSCRLKIDTQGKLPQLDGLTLAVSDCVDLESVFYRLNSK